MLTNIVIMIIRCLDIPNDPNGGIGCDGCGVMDCRLCGEGPYIPCE